MVGMELVVKQGRADSGMGECLGSLVAKEWEGDVAFTSIFSH